MGNIYSSSEVFKNLYDPGGLVGPRGFLHADGGCVGYIKGVHCSHDGQVGRLIDCRSKYNQPTKGDQVVRLDMSGV